jgi:type IV pilus assembly protein PilY1
MNRLLGKTEAFPFLAAFLLGCLLPSTRGASANMEGYCQYPPYVRQSVLPSVTLLVSNSVSMLQFAYGDKVDPANPCSDQANACGGFDPATRYYGIFDSDTWYTGATGSSGGFTKAGAVGGTALNPTGRGSNDWHGNFLNWLTTRRIDVMRKVLTGGTGDGTQLCGAGTAEWKKFTDTQVYTPVSATDQIVRFPKSTNCSGTLLGQFVLGTGATPYYPIRNKSVGTTSGIIQEMTPKASLGLAFYNSSDSQGAELNPQIDGSNLPISAYRNRIDTPSNFNGITVGAPLGEALWTIVGSYAREDTTSATGPRYPKVNNYNPNKDPYSFHGSASRCVKGSVIILSDGEPCNDGSLPTDYKSFDILNFADGTPLNCQGDTCLAAPEFGFSETTIPSCAAGGATAGLEDVALFAHTTDLRSFPTFGVDNLADRQNLDIYVIRAFGRDTSNLLKYAAINGTFEDLNGNGRPDPGEYSLSSAYFEADDGYAIARAMREVFENLLRRATSGTAASVLASGQGSGANLVQAVFYPRRRFFDEVIEWSGTLQNFWYYIDPFFGSSSIREESQKEADLLAGVPHTLHLVDDKTLSFFFDPDSGTTKANRYSNDPTTGNATGEPTVIPFEQAESIWEAGRFLHAGAPESRSIYTVTASANYGGSLMAAGNEFTYGRAADLAPFLGDGITTEEAGAIINYVRGTDDLANFRQRTVPHPTNTALDNTVWKLGDIINSTPRVVSSIPLNTYHKTYNDLTYDAFTKTNTYKNRGMVFVGANDGMLHAFKLGKLEFPGDAAWSSPGKWEKARLRNLDSTTGELGSERWAFVPKNALPYLRALTDNNYCHLYYVDLAPQVFDASINGADNAVRTASSWRTVLIGGMRQGGGCASPGSGRANAVDIPVAGVGYSSYFAIDVTDPEQPSVLWEFSDPALGFATTGPAVVRMNARNGSGNPDRTLNGKWFVVFGSGPTGPISDRQFLGRSDQTLKLFVVDLKSGALVRTIDQFGGGTIPNAFAGSILNSTADVDLDYQDDAVYVGYVKENSGTWNRGGVLRLQTKGSTNPSDWAASKVIDDIGPVTSSVVRLQNNILHTNWLFFGTGRYFFSFPSALDDPTGGRRLYGVKDPCFNSMNTMTAACTDTVSEGDLTNADTPPTTEPTRGWFINLDTASPFDYDGTGSRDYQAERVITDPLATSTGVVFFTSYRPYGGDCSIGGRTFLWAVQYNTGGVPAVALQGRALMQVSTASVEQIDLSTAFSGGQSRGGRRSYSLEGVPPMAQGLSLLSPPPPVRRIMHIRER